MPGKKRSLGFDRRVARFEFRPHVGEAEKIIKLMAAAGVEVLVASGMHQDGWAAFPSKVAVPHPEMNPDFIRHLISLAHRHDIMVLSWYNMRQNVPLVSLHPEWQVVMKLPDGRLVPEETNFCLFSSPYQEFVRAFSAEILQQGFDGLWYDGSWPGNREHPSCYCRWCQEAFARETGQKLPETIDWNNWVFRDWIRWRYRRFDEFVTGLYQSLVARWPQAIIMMNHYNRPAVRSAEPEEGSSWKWGVSIDVMKFPGGGGNENTAVINRLHTTGFNARIVKAQCPHRFDVWEPGGTLWRSVVYPELENDPTHSILHGVWTIALGGVPWTALTNVLTRHGKPDPAVMKEWKKRRRFLGGEALTYCGLHYSQSSRDFWGRNTPNAYYGEVYGWYDVAVEGHFLTDLVLDQHLTDLKYLQRYRVLILPNSACLSETQGETLRQFVRDGGVVVASYETGLYDENGEKRKDFLLKDVFGINYQETVSLTPGPWGKTIYDPNNVPRERAFVRIEKRRLKTLVAPAVFFGANYTKVKTMAGCAVLASTVNLKERETLFPGEVLNRAMPESPAITCHRFGKGKAVYVSAEAGRGFLQWPHPEARRLLENILGLGQPAITVRAPKQVEITAFRHKGGALAVHLVNLPWASNRPPVTATAIPVIDEIVPVSGIQVQIKQAGRCRVSLPLSREKPSVTRTGSTLIVTLPSLKYHQVVWIELV